MATSLGEAQPGSTRARLPSPDRVQSPESHELSSDREYFWNVPNTITVVRLAVLPVLVAFPWFSDPASSRIVAWLFIVAAVGDIVDGWAARWGQQITKIGKLLDPLADKITASTALIVLLAMDRIPIEGLVLVVVIVGRELAVTGLRGIASASGQVISAGPAGKIKMVAQNVAIGALLFPAGMLGLPNHSIGLALLTLATALTLWSGYVYFADYFGAEASGSR
ncbi:MAG: CDP-diacylglycerol--glycerol-3-phosphate 3-phosphatidyltransferase [Deltaproteobacteria bacterium]|nr:CDP-diacylglycerol--glycerol-3-phosphate 3-phosphatidyltransferase [Deltaproteobacteria bacterium]